MDDSDKQIQPANQLDDEMIGRIYELAQQSAEHHDTLVWEATYIVWGSTTLLLGFVLEAIDQQPFLCLITALLSIFMTLMVQRLALSFRKVRNRKYAICQEIEGALAFKWKQHQEMNTAYPKGTQTRWYIATTVVFVLIWSCVAAKSAYLLAKSAHLLWK
jgi:hypothetical protein